MYKSFLALVIFSSAPALFAAPQDTSNEPHSAAGTPVTAGAAPNAAALPGAINGSKHPELIPDMVIFHHFWRSVAEPSTGPTENLTRLHGKTKAMRFNDDDSAIIEKLAKSFADRAKPVDDALDVILRRTSAQPTVQADKDRLADLRSQLDTAVLDHIHLAHAQLSAEGRLKLSDQVARLRRSMILVPLPAMPK